MPQSLSRVILHIVFSTKERHPFLRDKSVREELYAVLGAELKAIDCQPILINGTEDHVHLLNTLSRNYAIKQVLEEIKKKSSKWIKTKGKDYEKFYWQAGYGVFSVSESQLPHVKRYIRDQDSHHKRMPFQDEFRMLCEKHGIKIDERHVWD